MHVGCAANHHVPLSRAKRPPKQNSKTRLWKRMAPEPERSKFPGLAPRWIRVKSSCFTGQNAETSVMNELHLHASSCTRQVRACVCKSREIGACVCSCISLEHSARERPTCKHFSFNILILALNTCSIKRREENGYLPNLSGPCCSLLSMALICLFVPSNSFSS